ncbi:hypothetical protein, partial [Bacillus sp. JJ1764]|uniref:hypothetical protein n=1 Tax=Bacillus sp. JJ1764 TaxID=3122964 RepID=UPI0030006213
LGGYLHVLWFINVFRVGIDVFFGFINAFWVDIHTFCGLSTSFGWISTRFWDLSTHFVKYHRVFAVTNVLKVIST